MKYDDVKCNKSVCEKYSLKFNSGWDWANFTIDDTGLLQCNSSFGNYSYQWGSFGDSFKKFLCSINSDYLINKISNNTHFDTDKYQEQAKKAIYKLRNEDEMDKEQARELFEFINQGLSDCGSSYDMVCREIYDNSLLRDLYDGEVFYSPFAPERDYPPSAVAFVNSIFPIFIRILGAELNLEK